MYAVALHSSGRAGDALKVLKEALVRHPDDRELLTARNSFSREAEAPQPRQVARFSSFEKVAASSSTP